MDNPKKIIIIEDQDDLRLLIRLTLKQLGQVTAAPDVNTAAALVQSERPDLVVLDVWLGNDLSGLDICRALKADASTSAIKVLLLSACGQQSDVEAGMEAGADRYVVKPFSPDLLVRTARELLSS
jgi:DNA-binding response OmpR family regulator